MSVVEKWNERVEGFSAHFREMDISVLDNTARIMEQTDPRLTVTNKTLHSCMCILTN
jgi:hypothetical protein